MKCGEFNDTENYSKILCANVIVSDDMFSSLNYLTESRLGTTNVTEHSVTTLPSAVCQRQLTGSAGFVNISLEGMSVWAKLDLNV